MMAPRDTIRPRPATSSWRARSRRRSPGHPLVCGVEILEDRQLLASFAVTNLGDSGAGSLRQAILLADAVPGFDVIDFAVAGTIRVGPTSLPAITDPVSIDGTTAPSFAGSPAVTVDFRGTAGLSFNPGSDGSILRSLSLVRAGGAGVTLNAPYITVQGNDIGLLADGTTPAGNRGDGIQINAASHGDLIGQNNPVTGVSYFNSPPVGGLPITGWQGIRDGATSGQSIITGTLNSSGLLYEGPINGVGGASYLVDYPGASTTSVYGPNLLPGGGLQLVGSYKTGAGVVNGFLFQGTTADLTNPAGYRTVDYPGATYTYVHSTMGGLAVGNGDGPEGNAPIGTGHAFLYNIATSTFTNVVYPGSTSTTAYGIWYNGGTGYTIVGGYSQLVGQGPIGNGYMVDYDAATGQFTHWTSFADPNGAGKDFITHFEGISGVEKGVYTLSADSLLSGSTGPAQGSFVSVRRNADGTFGTPSWVNLNFPGSSGITSSNSVAGNNVVGIVIAPTGTFSFQSTINVGFQLSNVISGNGGNGIGIYGSNSSQIAMNNIGTDVTGTAPRGNAQNGVLVTGVSIGNLIGGQATGGNNPTKNVFVRPPQGNLISGNGANGVLIANGPTVNLLSGNFIGTAASGNSALGNRLDGVAIVNASGNALIGCTYPQDPFVFYNVIGGNGGNGLRITNSNITTVQANFLGVGANNATIVGNGGDGLLISGTSAYTQVGGVIPLGNVISGNNLNGIEVRDQASNFISFNTFAGLYAFGTAAPNRRDGILITSSGGNNLIRTSIVSGNLGNGIELAGNATGVQVTETGIGTDTKLSAPLPNLGNGILITGNAHGNAIGGFQPSVEPQVTIAANGGYGVRIDGSARNNFVVHTYIGTNFNATVPLGNRLGGVYLGPGSSSTIIGGGYPALQNKIFFNGGNGVTINSSVGNAILGNQIAANFGYGVYASGVCSGSLVAGNLFFVNALGPVNLTKAKGVTYIP